jgi:hypothetical protein
MGVMLSILALLVAAAPDAPVVDVAPAAACPANQAVEGEIARMGAAAALARTGTTDITVTEGVMRIVLRAHDHTVLGMREVAAPAACQERAVVAAVMIVAWLGQWSGAAPRQAMVAAPPRPTPTARLPAPAPPARAPAAPSPPPLVAPIAGDVAAFGFGVHDGDAGTWGLGVQAGYHIGRHLSVTALGEGTGERARPLGPGQATYRSVRLAAGVALRHTLGRAFLDGGVGPALTRLSLRGQELTGARGATEWDPGADGRVRVGLRLAQARVVPFVYANATYSLAAARLSLDNRPDSVTLSRWNIAGGVGVLFFVGSLER